MNRVPIVIEPEAKSDIRAARDYYSDKGDQTSDRFRDELTQIFELLSLHPEAVAVAKANSTKVSSLDLTL